ncbi:alpha/beta fold hydrolase [Gordonia sp. X0973]|uniref:dienelactone hydrolase family protein n=1 Tax=Gordonia sp. X0973 TaxID=2742602 RepID=UPI000F53A030|nr:alpha/beta fold hydrolase [Gordonia sp. X0973]QKT07866.1 alpha/beta fold hydrolase [Gordonia sp. X0973]
MSAGHTVVIDLPTGTAEAFLAGAGPGVLLYMDAIGLRPQIEAMAQRIASWGYTVLAPNVFWRDGTAAELAPKTDLRIPGNREAFFASGVMDRVAALTPTVVRDDARVWLDTLAEHASAGPVAAVGYCFGGRLALRTAADFPDRVAAVGLFHSGGLVVDGPDSPHLLLPRVGARVLAGHADHDRSNSPEQIAAFDEALTSAGIEHATAVYPDAPHGYTMADTPMYQETGAQRHYDELRELLAQALVP